MARRRPVSEIVLDQAPQSSRLPDQEPPRDRTTALVTDVHTGKSEVLWSPPKGEVTFEHPTLAEIAKWNTKYLPLAAEVGTPEGYEKVRKAIGFLRTTRTSVDERRLECGSEAREYVKKVNAAGKLLIQRIEEIERPLKAAKEEVDLRAEREALARAQAIEEAQRKAEDERLAKVKAEEDAKKAAEEARLKAAQEEIDRAKAELVAERAKQQKLIDDHKALLAEQQRKFDEQQARQREEDRLVREATAKAQREAQAKIDAERKKIEDDKAAVVKAAQDKLDADKRSQEIKEAREAAAREAVAKVERDRANAERIAREDEERAEQERARKAASAPDRQKIAAWILAIQACTAPTVKGKEAMALVESTRKAIAEAVKPIMRFATEK